MIFHAQTNYCQPVGAGALPSSQPVAAGTAAGGGTTAAGSHPSAPAGAAIQMNNKPRSLLPRLMSLCVHAQQ